MMKSESILRVSDLYVSHGDRTAVRGVGFEILRGERVGLVGESGSGKSMTALSIMGLLPAGWRASGSVVHGDDELLTMSEKELADRRGRTISMVFQDPMLALNPVRRVGKQVADVLRRHQRLSKTQADHRVVELFEEMGLPRPHQLADAYPHQLSGGQRQRVMIATAVACSPDLIIADEPTTALDVTVQKRVLKLLNRTVEEHESALFLITHSLPVVAAMCEKVGVMYGGTIVEFGDVQDVLGRPQHPYTRALLRSQPVLSEENFRPDSRLPFIAGSVPSLKDMPEGCAFSNRCDEARALCRRRPPVIERAGVRIACWNSVRDADTDECGGES
ncbi:ABC transporter ATP-binding protein [Actinomyces mediterranea]|uniref:ABC transporter ATP-binding protein n=1 Tax=Actinomyces mediterranea TaxID=1871028 RepID=UPI001F3FA45D|nr:ABC transporter ATP-binding protein [Actinomyces mediterranea]